MSININELMANEAAKIVDQHIENLEWQLKRAQETRETAINKFKFKGPYELASTSGINDNGTYMVVHKETKRVGYIGQGNIRNRINRIKAVMRNCGEAIVHQGGSTSDHPGARKMYSIDPCLSNWIYLELPCTKDHSKRIESMLESKIGSMCNASHMSGVN